MDRSQWISLVIVILYILIEVFILVPTAGVDNRAGDANETAEHYGSILVFVGFACIWWPDMAGAVLLGARRGPLPDSWTIVVRGVGWTILALAIIMRIREL